MKYLLILFGLSSVLAREMYLEKLKTLRAQLKKDEAQCLDSFNKIYRDHSFVKAVRVFKKENCFKKDFGSNLLAKIVSARNKYLDYLKQENSNLLG
jgi:hypothetical protein